MWKLGGHVPHMYTGVHTNTFSLIADASTFTDELLIKMERKVQWHFLHCISTDSLWEFPL